MKQLAFLIICCTPYLKNIAQISSHFFLAESSYFHHFFVYQPQSCGWSTFMGASTSSKSLISKVIRASPPALPSWWVMAC